MATIAFSLTQSLAEPVWAQSYPQRPIKLVVPFPAGGANDTVARLVAQGVSRKLEQPFIIENQAGAGGVIGARQVATAAPDGHTLLMVVPSNTFGTAPVLFKLDYEPRKAFAPVATLGLDKLAMVVTPSAPAKTVQDLVQYAKANPKKLNYGSAVGIGPHFLMELFKINAGVDIVHVPYRGGAPMITDLLAGQIQMTINNKSVLLQHILGGKLNAVAVTAAERWPELPNAPTLVEAGYMRWSFETLFGIVAPAGTPAPIIETINRAINEVLQSADTRASFDKLGLDPKAMSPQAFAALIADEGPKWAEVAKTTGIKVE